MCVYMCTITYGCICVRTFVFEYVSTMYDFLFSYLSQSQRTALHWASEEGHHEIVQLLQEARPDVNRLDVVSCVHLIMCRVAAVCTQVTCSTACCCTYMYSTCEVV